MSIVNLKQSKNFNLWNHVVVYLRITIWHCHTFWYSDLFKFIADGRDIHMQRMAMEVELGWIWYVAW